jgi:mannose-6-phosphate isomerase
MTFRIYDWDRVDEFGNKRELHINRAMEVIHWDMLLPKITEFKETKILRQYSPSIEV